VLERGDCLIARYGREVGKKLVERVTALKVVEEGLKGDPGAHEHRLAPENVRIGVDYRVTAHDCVAINAVR